MAEDFLNPKVEMAWEQEIARRISAIENGTAQYRSVEEALEEIDRRFPDNPIREGTAADMEKAFQSLRPLTDEEAMRIEEALGWANTWDVGVDSEMALPSAEVDSSDKISQGILRALMRARLEARRRAKVYGTEQLLGFDKEENL
jgi:hypothetical protein